MTDFEPRLALFLGAGFSKGWGLPLANEIIDSASAAGFPGKWQVKLIGSVKQGWERAKTEGCTSVDEFGRLIQQSNGLYGLSYGDFTTFLALRLSSVHWQVGGARETKWGTGDHIRLKRTIPGPYREFLRGMVKSNLMGILTTNYDIVVEKILGPTTRGRLGGFRYCDTDEPLTGRHPVSSRWTYGPIVVTGKVPFLKLHGSLNFAMSSDQKMIKYIDARPSRGRRYDVLVVPPGGSLRRALLDEAWHDAGRVLREANVWIFCGYSLPDYDKDVRQLLRSNASEGQKVIVMDKAPVPVCKRLRDVLISPHIVVGPPVTSDLKSRKITSAISAVIADGPRQTSSIP